MKIPMAKLEGNETAIEAGPSQTSLFPNEAVFNALMQLLSNTPTLIDNTDILNNTQNEAPSEKPADNGQQQAPTVDKLLVNHLDIILNSAAMMLQQTNNILDESQLTGQKSFGQSNQEEIYTSEKPIEISKAVFAPPSQHVQQNQKAIDLPVSMLAESDSLSIDKAQESFLKETDIKAEDKRLTKPLLPLPVLPEWKTIQPLETPNYNTSETKLTQQISKQYTASVAPLKMQETNHVTSTRDEQFKNIFVQLGNIVNSEIQLPVTHQMAPTKASLNQSIPTSFDPIQDLKFELVNLSHPQADAIYDAKIKIYPPELGQITAKLVLEKNNAELVILTETNHVKELVEANLPLLKQHFAAANIHLVQVNIQNTDTNQSNHQQNKAPAPQLPVTDEEKTANLRHKSPQKTNNAIIDTYA